MSIWPADSITEVKEYIDDMRNIYSFTPSSFHGAGELAKQKTFDALKDRWERLPAYAQTQASRSYHGPKHSCPKLGFYDNVYQNDINFAFVHELARYSQYDTVVTWGDIEKGGKYKDYDLDIVRETLGFISMATLTILADIPPQLAVAPVSMYDEVSRYGKPINTGYEVEGKVRFEGGLGDLEFLRNVGAEVIIDPSSLVYLGPNPYDTPFLSACEELYQHYKQSDKRWAKDAGHRIYGGLGESLPTLLGTMIATWRRNAAIAGHITSMLRERMLSLAVANSESTLHISADSIITSEPLIPVCYADTPGNVEMGGMKTEAVGSGFIGGQGRYEIRDNDYNMLKAGRQGIPGATEESLPMLYEIYKNESIIKTASQDGHVSAIGATGISGRLWNGVNTFGDILEGPQSSEAYDSEHIHWIRDLS